VTTSSKDGGADAGSGALDGLDGLDGLDDPALRSMRAVWISMRDEEPPAAGLSALLAAAREKAEQMRPREPWWRRALAVMRRPPVLALATVTVLLSGAIVISGRREAFEVQRSAEPVGAGGVEEAERAERAQDTGALAPPEPATEPAAPAAGGAPPSGVAPGAGAAADGTPSAPATPDVTTRPPRDSKPAVRSGGAPPKPVAPSPSAALDAARSAALREKEKAASAAERRKLAREAFDGDALPAAPPAQAPPPPPPPPPQAPARPSPKGAIAPSKKDLQIADDGGGAAEVQAGAPAAGLSNDAGPSADSAGRPRGSSVSVSQLAKQSEAAAARGDCAAVRAIASQIRKLDPAFYKAHVEQHAAVKRCLQ
jgi:hypothetical protein